MYIKTLGNEIKVIEINRYGFNHELPKCQSPVNLKITLYQPTFTIKVSKYICTIKLSSM